MDVKISIAETSENARQINIEIPREIYDGRYKRELRKTAGQVTIKGFRPGKAPEQVVQKLYGDRIRSDVLGEIVNSAYEEAIKSNSLDVVGYPEFSIDDAAEGQDVVVKAAVALYPRPQIKDFEGLEFSSDRYETGPADVEHELLHLQERFAELQPVTDRSNTVKGDIVNAAYSGTVEGRPFPGSKADEIQIELGLGRYTPAFEDALIGRTLNEPFRFELTLDSEMEDEEFAGKQAEYEATIKAIYTKTVPPLTDDLAKRAGIDSLDKLREEVASMLERRTSEQNERAREDGLFKALSEKNSFEIPQVMVDEEIRSILFEMGLLDPKDKRSYQISVERFREPLMQSAEFRVRRFVMLQQLIEQLEIKPSDQEVEAWLDEEAAKAKVERKEIERAVGYPKGKERVRDIVARRAVVEKLFASAKIKEEIKQADHEHCDH